MAIIYIYIFYWFFNDKHEKPDKTKQGWYSACGDDRVGDQHGNGVSLEDKTKRNIEC